MKIADLSARHWSYDAPPLSAFAAFEAIARLGSFAAAAEELNRTPSAVSHAIRDIEKSFGVELFNRNGRNIVLTQIGELYLRDVRHAVDAIKRSTQTLRLWTDEPVIKVSAPPLIVATLLIPNMARFEAANKPYKLHIETSTQVANLATTEIDIAVRFVKEIDPVLHATSLPSIWGLPVGSPDYLKTKKIRSVEDLVKADFIEVVPGTGAMRRYLSHHGIPVSEKQITHRFDSTISALEAARQGLGITMGMFPLVSAYPGFGSELVTVRSEPFEYGNTYQLVCRAAAAELPRIALFRSWMVEVLEEMQAQYDRRR